MHIVAVLYIETAFALLPCRQLWIEKSTHEAAEIPLRSGSFTNRNGKRNVQQEKNSQRDRPRARGCTSPGSRRSPPDSDWKAENPPHPELFEIGGYGENLATTSLTESNIFIGDVFKVGAEVYLQVTEPRHPCYKLNARFQWPQTLKRTLRTGRHGWNFRVLQTGKICKGNSIVLVERTFPQWSIMNVSRVIRAKEVSLSLLAECMTLPITDLWRHLAEQKLKGAPKTYTLSRVENITAWVKKFTFVLKDHIELDDFGFEAYAYAQICFGPNRSFSRSYSIVEGDLHLFSLGVALDDSSRGGSAYLHRNLKVGDEIEMVPGSNPKAVEDDKKCEVQKITVKRLVIIGGIGVTAFLPAIREWESKGIEYEIHYATRSPEEAAFLDILPQKKTTLYAKSAGNRLDIAGLISHLNAEGTCPMRLFFCGPSRMMQAGKLRAAELGYPEHMVHLEDFGGIVDGEELGDGFEVEVDEPGSNRHETLQVPSNRTMLDVLNEAGFDVLFSCKSGACGACRVSLCQGKVDFKSETLSAEDKREAMQACVDRGVGKIRIEID